MTDFSDVLFGMLMRVTVGMSVAAMVAYLILRFSSVRSPTIHRITWAIVLLQGVFLIRFDWQVPVLATPAVTSMANRDLPSEKHFGDTDTLGDLAGSNNLPSSGERALQSNRGDSGSPMAMALTGADRRLTTSEKAIGATVVPNQHVSSAAPLVTVAAQTTSLQAGSRGFSGQVTRGITNWKSSLLLVWMVGVVGLLLVNLFGLVVFQCLIRRVTTAPKSWALQWNRLLWKAGESRIPMKVHDSVGPMVCWRPGGVQLIVPRDLWEEFNDAQRLSVLRHELAHHVRGDIWKSLSVRCLAILYWFNPFAWMAVKRFDESGEWACDQYMVNKSPSQAPEFARALLRIVQLPPPGAFCVTTLTSRAADGSLLSERVRRLLSTENKEDSTMKRMFVFAALSGLLLSCLFQIRAVAHSPIQTADAQAEMQEEKQDSADTASARLDPAAAVKDFATKIQSEEENDELIEQLKKVVATEAGQIALQERASWAEDNLRQQAEESGLPAYLNQHFDSAGNGELTLKSGQDKFRAEYIQRCAVFEKDVIAINIELAKISANIKGDSEADKLLRQFTSDKNAGWLLYINGLNEEIRPDVRSLQERLADLLVADQNGKLSVRPGSREQVAELLGQAEQVGKIVDSVHDELKTWSSEMAEPDDLHKNLKAVFADKFYATVVCVEQLMEGPDSVQRNTNQMFKDLEWVFKDTSDGLVVAEGREWMEEIVVDFKQRNGIVPMIKPPLDKMLDHIDASDPNADKLKAILNSPLAIVHLTADMNDISPDAATALHRNLEYLLEGGGGEEFSVPEAKHEAVIEFVTENKSIQRAMRRKFREIDSKAASIKDPDLKKALLSDSGKCLLIQSVREGIAFRNFDGLGHWVNENFEKTSVGFVLKDESRDEISEYLNQVKEMEAELENDDF